MSMRYWEAAAQIVAQQAGQKPMTKEEIVDSLRYVAAGLYQVDRVGADCMGGLVGSTVLTEHLDRQTQPQQILLLSPAEAIQEEYIVCLECGLQYLELTEEHLATHKLTVASYRAKHGYGKDTPLMCGRLLKEMKAARISWPVISKEEAMAAVTEEGIKCFECEAAGEKKTIYQTLTNAHFRKHGMSKDDYMAKYGYPPNMPLMGKAFLKGIKTMPKRKPKKS